MLTSLVPVFLSAILFAGPAKNRPAHCAESGESVLPGGRLITP